MSDTYLLVNEQQLSTLEHALAEYAVQHDDANGFSAFRMLWLLQNAN